MKTGISKREKILLFVVGIIAILYVSIQFVILPLSERYNTGLRERETLITEVHAHELAVGNLPLLRERYDETYERFDSLTSGYPRLVPNEETDRMLTTRLLNNNFNISSLRFAPRPAAPPPPIIDHDDDGKPIYGEPRFDVFTKVTVFINATGTYEDFLQVLSEVSNTEYLRLTNVSFQRGWMAAIDNAATISLTFEVTYLT